MDFLNSPTAALVFKFVAAFAVVLVLIFAAMWIFRFIRGAGLGIGGSGRSRQPRLAVLDFTDVDSRRRLVLIRRDNVEHLILLGGPTDVVVETNIVRGQAAVPNPARDLEAAPTLTEPSQLTVPVEPPRAAIRDIARAAAGEGPRVTASEAEAEERPRVATPGRSLFNSFTPRRETAPAAPPPVLSPSETTKPEAPMNDELSAKLDAALRKPLTVSPTERRPMPPVPPLRATPPVLEDSKPTPEPVPAPASVEPTPVLEAPLAPAAPAPVAAPVIAAPSPPTPTPPLRAPVFAPAPPMRPKPPTPLAEPTFNPPSTNATGTEMSPPAPSVTTPPVSSVRGPATAPLTPSERSVFDSLEEEMASLLGRTPKAP